MLGKGAGPSGGGNVDRGVVALQLSVQGGEVGRKRKWVLLAAAQKNKQHPIRACGAVTNLGSPLALMGKCGSLVRQDVHPSHYGCIDFVVFELA